MHGNGSKQGLAELGAARRKDRPLYWIALIFGIFANLLLLTGPVYMLQVYDRVLASRSTETLLVLSLLAGFLFLLMGFIDLARARLTSRIGTRLYDRLQGRVFAASQSNNDNQPLTDLAAIERAFASPVVLAAHDVFWVPVFITVIALFHPLLAWAAVVGGATLIILAFLNDMSLQRATCDAAASVASTDALANRIRDPAFFASFVGHHHTQLTAWRLSRRALRHQALHANDVTSAFSAAIRTFRMVLQSAMLGVGAWLALRGEISPGVMIAASILLGRALAPIEVMVAHWSIGTEAIQSWRRLAVLLGQTPMAGQLTKLPRPRAILDVQHLSIIAPGERIPKLRVLNFQLRPGQALGVIGPSSAGKSLLAQALVGQLQPAAGDIRLDGATLPQFGAGDLARHIGYLPQVVTLFRGSVAENIDGFSESRDSVAVIEAARTAGAHEMIKSLASGYDTDIGPGGAGLSAGQVQRIGLARALFGNPVFLVLDEPMTHLDSDGAAALNNAIAAFKAKEGAIIVLTNRPSAVEGCDQLLILDSGQIRALGKREHILAEMAQRQSLSLVQGRRGA